MIQKDIAQWFLRVIFAPSGDIWKRLEMFSAAISLGRGSLLASSG